MSPYALIVRLPSGGEYWWTENLPVVGDTVSHAGSQYLVVGCEPEEEGRFVLTLQDSGGADEPFVGAAPSPSVL